MTDINCILTQTRYQGHYEGGRWAAFAEWEGHYYALPTSAFADDVTASHWWNLNRHLVGVGHTPDDAVADLERKLRERPPESYPMTFWKQPDGSPLWDSEVVYTEPNWTMMPNYEKQRADIADLAARIAENNPEPQ